MKSRPEIVRGPFRKIVREGPPSTRRGRTQALLLECNHVVTVRARAQPRDKVRCKECGGTAVPTAQPRVTRLARAMALAAWTTVAISELAAAGVTVGEVTDALALGMLVPTGVEGTYRATVRDRQALLRRRRRRILRTR